MLNCRTNDAKLGRLGKNLLRITFANWSVFQMTNLVPSGNHWIISEYALLCSSWKSLLTKTSDSSIVEVASVALCVATRLRHRHTQTNTHWPPTYLPIYTNRACSRTVSADLPVLYTSHAKRRTEPVLEIYVPRFADPALTLCCVTPFSATKFGLEKSNKHQSMRGSGRAVAYKCLHHPFSGFFYAFFPPSSLLRSFLGHCSSVLHRATDRSQSSSKRLAAGRVLHLLRAAFPGGSPGSHCSAVVYSTPFTCYSLSAGGRRPAALRACCRHIH